MIKVKYQRSNTIKDGASPTKERRTQNGGVRAEIINQDARGHSLVRRYRAVWECPLDAYCDYGVIDAEQHKAGIKFKQTYYGAVGCRAMNDRMGPVDEDLQVSKLEKVLRGAFRQLSPNHREAVIDACGHNLLITDLAKIERLKTGLGQLVKLWNITAKEVCDRR